MKLQLPLYEGDSIIRYGPTTSPDPVAGPQQSHSTPKIPQRSSSIGAATDSAVVDIAEIEARARALRAEAIAELAGRAWTWLGTYFERARRRREEEYLARSQSLAELEHRLRKLERQGHLLHV
ncbi:MAG: RSP_7527 family protein [Burkholderiales bacterium]